MTDVKVKLPMRLADGSFVDVSVSFSRVPPWRLTIESASFGTRSYEDEDLFECLVDARRDFENDGALILCNGSRRDAFPSPLAREMSGGQRVYVMELGTPVTMKAVVNTFDPAPSETVGSVDEQRSFYDEWKRSLEQTADTIGRRG